MSLIAEYWPSLVTVLSIHIIALISPGPDFAIVVRNSLLHSRLVAFFTAFGVACGVLVHISYILLGVGVLIAETVWLFTLFKIAGAGYLMYIGYKGLMAKKPMPLVVEKDTIPQTISASSGFRSGFVTNALNPKCTLFLLSLFTVVIGPNTPPLMDLIYGVAIFISTLLWFMIVAAFFSGPKVRFFFSQHGHWVDRVTGAFLIMVAVKLALLG